MAHEMTGAPLRIDNERARRRRHRKRRTIWKRLPEELVSTKLTFVQILVVLGVAYFAFKVIVYLAEYNPPPPGE